MEKIRTEFKKLIIEAIHGLPYEKAISRDWGREEPMPTFWSGYPITIGRVIKTFRDNITVNNVGNIKDYKGRSICFWELTKECGQECTDDDQTDETIKKLCNLLKDGTKESTRFHSQS